MQQDRTHSRVGCPLEHRRRDSIALTSHQWIMKPAVWQLKLVRRLVSHLVLYVLCMYTEEFMVGSMTLRSCCCKTSPNHHTSTISSWYKMFQLIGLFRFSHYSQTSPLWSHLSKGEMSCGLFRSDLCENWAVVPCSFSYKPLKTSHTCSFFFSNCTIKNFRWGLESLTCSSWAFCSFAKQRWGKFAGMSTSGKFGSCVQFLLVNDRSHGRMMVFKLFGNLLVTLPRQIGSNNCFSKIITWLGCHRVCGTLWWFCGSPLDSVALSHWV